MAITFYNQTADEHWCLRADIQEVSTSVENNTSTVQVSLYLGRFDMINSEPVAYPYSSEAYQTGANYSLRVDYNNASNQWGTYSKPSRQNFNYNTWYPYGTHTSTVKHNADGTGKYERYYYIQSLNTVKPVNGVILVSLPLTNLLATPGVPSNLNLRGQTNNSNNIVPKENLLFSWTAGSSATSYDVELRTKTGNTWTSWSSRTTPTSTTSTRTFPINSVGCDVQMRVRSVNSKGTSNWVTSNTVHICGGINIKQNGSWKTGRIYVKSNGVWKPSALFQKTANGWKSSK